MIVITDYVRQEWSRFAQAAYFAGRNDVGHRYSAAAALPADTRVSCAWFDALQAPYRAWLVFNEYPTPEA